MSYQNGLNILSINPKLIGKLCNFIGSMPNIDFPTMGGHFFWDTLCEANGWELQKNKLTDHCRIIDPGKIRKAWGSEIVLKKALGNLANVSSNENTTIGSNSEENHRVFCSNCGKNVPNGKYCKECGSLMD